MVTISNRVVFKDLVGNIFDSVTTSSLYLVAVAVVSNLFIYR